MVDESRVMDVDALLKQQEWSPEEFAVVLYKYTEMTKEIREMKLTKRVAMLRVDARGFASSALPYPQVTLGFYISKNFLKLQVTLIFFRRWLTRFIGGYPK